MDRRDISRTLPLMGAGTEFFNGVVDSLPDDALRAPSGLDGWSRAHLIAHVARNAEALIRLAEWARTGVENRMYPSPESRAADIEATAVNDPATLRRELLTTAGDLDAALAALDEKTWEAEVRTAADRPIPATEVPWMRIREVWLHSVDLDAGVAVADLPSEVVDALIDDAAPLLGSRAAAGFRLVDSERGTTWAVGTDPVVDVHGTAAQLCGWLLGRTRGDELTAVADGTPSPLPEPPRWL
ncbi:maleylpyruvate isomerase family mycothiol-dependent enzyme [Actinomycetes bacterium KLBMP 9759]